MNDPLTEVRFWEQIIGDSRRTVYCSPEWESRIKTWVDVRGMGGIITVVATRMLTDDLIVIFDEQALQAELSRPAKMDVIESSPRPYRLPYLWSPPPADPTAYIRITGT